jgi:starch synthase (maltosyl-transferring)
VLTDPTGVEHVQPMVCTNPGLNTWAARVSAPTTGWWTYRVEGWSDPYGTWEHDATIKVQADVDTELMLEEGALVLERALDEVRRTAAQQAVLSDAVLGLRDTKRPAAVRLKAGTDGSVERELAARPLREYVSPSADLPLLVERELALSGAWYELFPRSEGATYDEKEHRWTTGTLRTAAKRLPAIAAMGFDVVYLTPVHPIGQAAKKGPNNTLDARPEDPGSPYAIGSPDGGHDAIHPDLGTFADFDAFVAEAERLGMEVAMDLALQCSPDHPWVAEHPEWFTTRADGTIAYAENPPKKYQDIYPLNFDNDPAGIYAEVRRVVQVWIDHGVKIFRVDNPHTKPLQFWEWLIGTINAENPDVVFLAEAFTRPAPMQGLAMAGFQQSYSYFTWRNTKEELEEFLGSVSSETADFMRPNLFVNTPDILTEFLQYGGRPGYKIRAAIAATAAPLYGVYAGYELFENVARPGSEENVDNEKYEYKLRDWAAAEESGDSLAPFLTKLNEIRREHPALGQLRNFTAHWSDDDAILVYSKHLDAALSPTGRSDTLIVVANVDPHSVRQTMVHLDTRIWGVRPGDPFEVEELLTGQQWTWSDHDFVRLDAFHEPVHILHVKEPR